MTNNTTSKCPLGKCDGSGIIYTKEIIEGREIKASCICECSYDIQEMKKRSKIPLIFENCTINEFNINYYNDQNKPIAKAAKKAAANFVINFSCFKEKGKGLYLFSFTKGSGKTRLACSIANALIQTKFINVKFVKTIDLITEIKSTYGKNSEISEIDILDKYKKCTVLILDDIGAENPTDWTCGIFLNLLDYRITSKHVTIFTSNVSISNLRLDERIADRIAKMAIEIDLPEESVRRHESAEENEKLEDILYS